MGSIESPTKRVCVLREIWVRKANVTFSHTRSRQLGQINSNLFQMPSFVCANDIGERKIGDPTCCSRDIT